ncbi:MAG: GNAT family N-acetyltransferase [Phycisphaerae bacterium]|nr:GNAT family N-acetyltransferase [Phycisphaerae bacterium]
MFRIETERLTLAAHQVANVELLNRWENDAETNTLLTGHPREQPEMLAEAEECLREALDIDLESGRIIDCGVYLKPQRRLLGWAQIARIDRRNRSCVLALCIGEPADRGYGYGRDALTGMIEFCFGEIGMNRVGCAVFAFNRPCLNLIESLGFIREGAIRQSVLREDGPVDEYLFGLLKSEWGGNGGQTTRRQPPGA